MASASDYLEEQLANHIFNDPTFTPPSTFYLALCTAATADSDTGSTITEASYTGYARKSFTATDLNAWAAGVKSNGNAITFAQCTGGSATATHYAIVDAASAGNMLLHGALNSSLAIFSGVTPEVAAGDLDLTVA